MKQDELKLESLLKKRRVTQEQLHAIIDQIKHPLMANKSRVQHFWSSRHVKVGLLGDTHIGSKSCDYAALRDMMKRFKAERVDAVYQVGDLTEGYNRRKGHSYGCDLHGADEQVRGVVDRMPYIGKPMFFIGGDHDGWHYDNAGVDVGKAVESKRDDMHYLGPFSGSVEFSKGTRIDLIHPDKGSAYALSYKPQKIAESISGGEKPNILAIGHYHKIEQLFYRNIHIFQCGTTQSQTDWMKRMNLSAHKAAWVLDVFMKKDGSIDQLKTTLLPYYT